MEFIDGLSVKDKIAARPRPLEDALDIAMQTALDSPPRTRRASCDIKPPT